LVTAPLVRLVVSVRNEIWYRSDSPGLYCGVNTTGPWAGAAPAAGAAPTGGPAGTEAGSTGRVACEPNEAKASSPT
jgi:hypothetical protein